MNSPGLNSLEAPQYFLNSHPQHDGASVRTGKGIVAAEELIQKPLHFLLGERCVDLDGGLAGQADGNLLAQPFHAAVFIDPLSALGSEFI